MCTEPTFWEGVARQLDSGTSLQVDTLNMTRLRVSTDRGSSVDKAQSVCHRQRG